MAEALLKRNSNGVLAESIQRNKCSDGMVRDEEFPMFDTGPH